MERTKPRLVLGMCLENLGRLISVIELIRRAIGVPAFRQDQNVLATLGPERL